MIKVAIFPCGSEAGLEIHNALRHEKNLELFGASSVRCHGEALYANYDNTLPYITADDFVEKFNDYLRRNEIDFVFPAYDDVIIKLAQIGDRLAATAVVPSLEVCEIARSKSLTYEALKDLAICPRYTLDPSNISEFPVFAKPDRGQGSQGVAIVKDQQQLAALAERGPGLIYCELLTGPEYTIDCFADRHGHLLFCGIRERQRTKSGISVRTTTSSTSPEIIEIAHQILKRIPFRGVWFFQLKQDAGGNLKLLEVAPRVAGSMAANRARGANLALLSLYDRQDMDVSVLVNEGHFLLERYMGNRFVHEVPYDHVYLDFDDTLTHKGKVNLTVIQFVFFCHNLGKRITLITRHAHDLSKTLASLRLSEGLFDEIVHIRDDRAKSELIAPAGAIFIDDSFAERKDVWERHKIPVFSVDAVEALIDWRKI